jgi:hypothetical protein
MLPSCRRTIYEVEGISFKPLISNGIQPQSRGLAAAFVWPVSCQYGSVIAKTILDLFTLLPGASRTPAQNSDQPLQAFSDSLLAATKSYSADSSVAASSKTGRRQRSASDDANAQVAVLDGGPALSPDTLQPVQVTDASLGAMQTPIAGLTLSDGTTTDAAAQSNPAQQVVEPATSQSSAVQIVNSQAGAVPTRTLLTAGFQTRFTAAKTFFTRSAATPVATNGAITQPIRNVTFTWLAGLHSSVAPSVTTQPAAVQSDISPAQMPLAEQATTQNTAVDAASPIFQNSAQVEPVMDQSLVALADNSQTSAPQQASALSNLAAVQRLVAQPATTPSTSTVATSQPTWTAPAADWNQSESSIAPATILQTSVSQLVSIPTKAASTQLPVETATTTQAASTAAASQPSWIAPAFRWDETPQHIALASTVPASISQPAAVQTSAASAQASAPASIPQMTVSQFTDPQSQVAAVFAAPVAAQHLSSVPAIQNVENAPVAKSNETEAVANPASVISTSNPQLVASQSNAAAVQPLVEAPATTPNTSAVAASQPALNSTAAGWTRSGTSFTPASIVSTSVPQPVSVQSTVVSVQAPLDAPPTTMSSLAGISNQPVQSTPSAGWNEAEPVNAPASIAPENSFLASTPQPAPIPSSVPSAQMPVAQPATIQSTSASVASEPAWIAPAARWNEAPATVAQANIISASISQPIAVQSNVAPVQAPVATLPIAQATSSVAASTIPQSAPVAGSFETAPGQAQLSSAPASTPQTVSAQSNALPVQIFAAVPATIQIDPTAVASQQPVQSAPVTQSNQTAPSIAPAAINLASVAEPAAAESEVAPVQANFVVPPTAQIDPTSVASQPAQNVPAVESHKTESSIAPASIATTSIPQPATVQSNFIQVQAPAAAPAPVQSTSAAVASQPTMNVAETGSIEAQAAVAQAGISLPAAIQSYASTVRIPVAEPATTQKDSLTTASQQQVRTLPASELSEVEKSIAPTEIASTNVQQPAAVQSNARPVEISNAEAATTQSAPTVVASQQPAQTLPAAGLSEVEPSIASPEIAPTNVRQPAAVQSKFTPAQAPLIQPAPTQRTVSHESVQPALNVRTAEPVEAQTSVSETAVSQNTVVEPAGIQSSVKPSSIEPSRSSSKLPDTGIQEATAPIAAPSTSANPDPIIATTASNAVPANGNSQAQVSQPNVASSASSSPDQSAVASSPADSNQPPVLRAAIASVKDAVVSTLKAGSTPQADPQPAAADQSSAANTITAPGGISDQQASLPLMAGPIGTIQTSAASLKPDSAAKPQGSASTSDKISSTSQTAQKKNAEPISESKSNSKDAASSGNQNQDGNAPQAQIATPVPVSFTIHPAAVIAAAQNIATAATSHTSSTPAGSAGVAAKTADNTTAPTPAVLPQTAPVINTAKLIQSMGQSEMRVGMRSSEFGNISISTSTIKDQVSAQISLEHGELARTLVAHLPEMQARLGGSQPMDVRIDMNGAATGQGTGNFGGMQNDTTGQSRSGRQQAGNMAAGQSGNSVVEQQFSPVVAAAPSGYARLDIRV